MLQTLNVYILHFTEKSALFFNFLIFLFSVSGSNGNNLKQAQRGFLFTVPTESEKMLIVECLPYLDMRRTDSSDTCCPTMT